MSINVWGYRKEPSSEGSLRSDGLNILLLEKVQEGLMVLLGECTGDTTGAGEPGHEAAGLPCVELKPGRW